MKMQTWIKLRYLPSGQIERKCSNCGFTSAWVSAKWKFCPGCGYECLRPVKERKVNEIDNAEG